LREGGVRVRVRAAGINFADLMVRLGFYEAAKSLYPMTPGFEFAGVVAESRSSRWKPGDEVLGITRFGAYAEELSVDERQLWALPAGWTFEQAAALPAVQLTAYYGLFRAARVLPEETVLVHSAAGGAGGAFLAQAKAAGCRAVAVVGGAHKAELCRTLGADAVIVRAEQDLWKEAERLAPKGYDAIFDANGVSTLREGYKRLAPGGRLVVYGFAEILPRGGSLNPVTLAYNYLSVPKFSPLHMTGANRGVLGFNVVYLFDRLDLAGQAMRQVLAWVAEKKIPKPPVKAFPWRDVAQAHQLLSEGQTTGKLVLRFN
jgi:synaptic vesicle membrane protein VAT-1